MHMEAKLASFFHQIISKKFSPEGIRQPPVPGTRPLLSSTSKQSSESQAPHLHLHPEPPRSPVEVGALGPGHLQSKQHCTGSAAASSG